MHRYFNVFNVFNANIPRCTLHEWRRCKILASSNLFTLLGLPLLHAAYRATPISPQLLELVFFADLRYFLGVIIFSNSWPPCRFTCGVSPLGSRLGPYMGYTWAVWCDHGPDCLLGCVWAKPVRKGYFWHGWAAWAFPYFKTQSNAMRIPDWAVHVQWLVELSMRRQGWL